MSQKIRPSQFIYNYGPGAILETRNGPRMILSSEIGLFYNNSDYLRDLQSRYEITSLDMSEILLKDNDGTKGRIFRLPTNDELKEENITIYKTSKFPIWNLCMNSLQHSKSNQNGKYIIHMASSCPICKDMDNSNPIRFVSACPNGHLDEVDWYYIAHGYKKSMRGIDQQAKGECKNEKYFTYDRGSGTIASIKISCPVCKNEPRDFSKAYGATFECTKRRPEKEERKNDPHRPKGCDRRMRIIQRQASNLRIPEIVTLLQLKIGSTELGRFAEKHREGILMKRPDSIESFREALDTLNEIGNISDADRDKFSKSDWTDVKSVIEKLNLHNKNVKNNRQYSDLVLDEYRELINGTKFGIPPQKNNKSDVLFEMPPAGNPELINKHKFIVAPIVRLSTITVQRGYRREIPDRIKDENKNYRPSKLLLHNIYLKESKWYPGMESVVEGIFIMLGENDGFIDLKGETAARWRDSLSNSFKYDDRLLRDPIRKDELDPVFVWWHTLAHALVRVIGEESGYSSSSIRERIFTERIDGRMRGGILLYTTHSGNEGSLGGLISLVPRVKHIFDNALDIILHCSGDPLCFNYKFGQDSRYNGSACYGCTMNSETSCEHQNMWLDRHIIMENLP